ncbi:MAG TPA: hypothetical protein VHA82_16650 [Ramlibacter sp.]|uniref:hypothetical protein n=1 Tax=Ramlibacter sp. TaxID=1917967 RepID=UPI002C9AD57C|nr:hypothetical protein [Ramlibacter sp.]HVZ45443.1 hypothetical protein [Ramlibacter sp.]
MKSVLAAASACILLSGCVSMVVGAVVTAADVAVGAVKLTGKAVGAAADLVIPDGRKDEK